MRNWSIRRAIRAGIADLPSEPGGSTAVGRNARAATLSGPPGRRFMVTAFGLSGLITGLAGISAIAVGGAAWSYGFGSDLLVPDIAAALAGGTAITGGSRSRGGIVK